MERTHEDLAKVFAIVATEPEKAFDSLYRDYYKMMFGIAFSVLKNETQSQDVVQNVMLRLYQLPLEKFPTTGELCWLYKVVQNEALQLLRGEKPVAPIEQIEAMAVNDQRMEALVDDAAYEALLKGLDSQARDIIAMKVISGMTHKEIGKVLHLPTGTVQWKYHKSIHKLQLLASNVVLFAVALSVALFAGSPSAGPQVMTLAVEPQTSLLQGGFVLLAVVLGISGIYFLKNFSKKPTN